MTAINVTATEAQVAVTASNSRVTITEQPVHVQVTPQNSTVTVNETTNQLVVQVPTAPTVTIQESTGGTITLDTSSPSLSTLLDSVRTDVDDTTFTYSDGKLATVTREGVVKTFAYNEDGTLSTLTTVTNTKTVVQTFNYGSNGLTSIAVT